MKKLIAVVLCAFIMLSGVTACSSSGDEKDKTNITNEAGDTSNATKIIGTWEASVNMTDMMKEIFALDEAMGEYINISDFTMKFIFTFNDNSIMDLKVDEDALAESFDKLLVNVKDGMISYFEAMIEASELDMSVDELLEKSNIDLETLVEEMSNAAIEAMKFDEMSFECYYELNGNKLYSYDSAGGRNEDEYIEIEFADEDTIQFVEVKSEETGSILEMIEELKRVSK